MREKNEGAKTFFGPQNFQFPMLWADKFCTLPKRGSCGFLGKAKFRVKGGRALAIFIFPFRYLSFLEENGKRMSNRTSLKIASKLRPKDICWKPGFQKDDEIPDILRIPEAQW